MAEVSQPGGSGRGGRRKPTNKSRYQNVIDMFDEITITGIERYALSKATQEDLRLIEIAQL